MHLQADRATFNPSLLFGCFHLARVQDDSSDALPREEFHDVFRSDRLREGHSHVGQVPQRHFIQPLDDEVVKFLVAEVGGVWEWFTGGGSPFPLSEDAGP